MLSAAPPGWPLAGWLAGISAVIATAAPAATVAVPVARAVSLCLVRRRCRAHVRAARSGETRIGAVNCRMPSRASSSMSELMTTPLRWLLLCCLLRR
jgi:hypothetical protein